MTGDNNALIVVDGIVIDNSSSRGSAGSASTGYADYGNRFNDINPENIESVTVLKEPSATSIPALEVPSSGTRVEEKIKYKKTQ